MVRPSRSSVAPDPATSPVAWRCSTEPWFPDGKRRWRHGAGRRGVRQERRRAATQPRTPWALTAPGTGPAGRPSSALRTVTEDVTGLSVGQGHVDGVVSGGRVRGTVDVIAAAPR